MDKRTFRDGKRIIKTLIDTLNPVEIVKQAVLEERCQKEISLFAIGKASWEMAYGAYQALGDKIKNGIVITKYDHSKGPIGNVKISEAGHPVPDQNGLKASKEALERFSGLGKEDILLFLISGGGSALFEVPFNGVTLEIIQDVTENLLRSGADINTINAVRKRLSAVKGGQFAEAVSPARIKAYVISDVIGNKMGSIASGPVTPPEEDRQEVMSIVRKYDLNKQLNNRILNREMPSEISNVEYRILDSIEMACANAAKIAEKMGYSPYVLTTRLECEAAEAGRFIAEIAQELSNQKKKSQTPFQKPCALIFGGETVVTVKGKGLGGRNQELALSVALELDGEESDTTLLSFGTDGTDGPTDAAGGIVTGTTASEIRKAGISPREALENNDSYHALDAANSLIKTGPTGTNVNDIIMALFC